MNNIFRKLNCSETQAKLYLFLLQNGPSIASIIGKRIGIKRVTVYGALEGLLLRGVVEGFTKNHVTYYQASDPEVIRNLLDLQLETEQEFIQHAYKKIDELKKKQRKSEKNIFEFKGVIQYYEGRDAVQSLINETLKLPDTLQYCIGLSGYHALQFAGEWEDYIKARVKNGMKVLSLQADTHEGRAYQSRDHAELRETHLLPRENLPEQGELNIIGDRIILFTSEENEAIGVKITNKKIAKILKKLFEIAWEYARNRDIKKQL